MKKPMPKSPAKGAKPVPKKACSCGKKPCVCRG
jgi:hypothetical protein